MTSQGSQGHNSRLFGIVLSTYEIYKEQTMNEKQFSGKVALVTGATSGIGQACALAFARAGAKVVCVGRKAEALKEVEEKIRDTGGEVLTIEADMALTETSQRVVARALEV